MISTEPTPIGTPVNHPGKKLDLILGRMDLAAVLVTLLGVCTLAATGVLLAIIELAKLLSNIWSESDERYLLIFFGVGLVWVIARWKRLCIF